MVEYGEGMVMKVVKILRCFFEFPSNFPQRGWDIEGKFNLEF